MTRRQCVARGFNLSVFLAFLLTFGLVYFYAQPLVKRGFFCDDESLAHPIKPNTVPTWTLLSVSLILPLLVIVAVDTGLLKAGRDVLIWDMQNFMFGFFVNLLFTELTKYTIGRLRPNFFAMCAIDFSTVDCGNKTNPLFVTDYKCPGFNSSTFQAKNSRLSFVSGHSSIACASAFFVIFYLQAKAAGPLRQRLPEAGYYLVPLAQVATAVLALFTALTRISDYWHHPTDVLAGCLLGVGVQYWNCAYNMGIQANMPSQLQSRNKLSNSYARLATTGSQTDSDDDDGASRTIP